VQYISPLVAKCTGVIRSVSERVREGLEGGSVVFRNDSSVKIIKYCVRFLNKTVLSTACMAHLLQEDCSYSRPTRWPAICVSV